MNILIVLVIAIVLYALQDVIAVKMDWYPAKHATRNWYVFSTIFISWIINVML